MIILGLLELVFGILQVLFSWLNLPDMPEEITSIIDSVVEYVVDALPLIWCFLDKDVVTVCLVISLACMNFEKVYYFLMWILAKVKLSKD